MTIILPGNYHAREALVAGRVVCIEPEVAERQEIRPLRIGVLNVMPMAETYEEALLHPLGRSIIQIEPVWIRLESHSYKSSNTAHLDELYVTFEQATKDAELDGMIITGAPVEELAFEEVRYWTELSEILQHARTHCPSTLGICWGGMVLGYLLGCEKVMLEQKLFGAYPLRNLARKHRITGDTDDVFWCPQSRHASVSDEQLEDAERREIVTLLAHSDEVGYSIFESRDQRFIAHLGHPEYEPERLVFEYERDCERGRSDVAAPVGIDLAAPANVWRSHRNEFFLQWVKSIYDRVSLDTMGVGISSVRPIGPARG
jgi:homoserine O-succinyltransferase